MVTISFVIPVHNEEETVGFCLSSLKNLNIPSNVNIEIIAVLDRCTDNSEKIISKFSGIKIIKKNSAKWNYKYSETINVGMKHAKGDYFVILDSDTVLDKNWLVEVLKSLKNNKVASVSGRLKIARISLTNKMMKESTTPLGCNRIYRSGIWRKNKGYKDMYAPDTELDLRIIEEGFIVVLNPQAIAYDLRKYTLKKIWRNSIEKGMSKYQLRESFKFVFASGVYNLLTNPFGILLLLGNIIGVIRGKVQKLERYDYRKIMKYYEARRLRKKY